MNFEHDDASNSSYSSQVSSNNDAWFVLEQNLKKDEIDDYIQRDIPPSNSFQTNKATYCLFCVDILERHKAKEQLRKCKICNVKYSIKFCEKQNIGSISQKYLVVS